MVNQLTAYSRYLPVEPDAVRWGIHVVDCGYSIIPAGSPYPPLRHPDNYMFTWEQGRILSEYQLVYITRGEGVFESKTTGQIEISAGEVFILFPSEWHRYRPQEQTGWDENWIGFDGEYARQIMERFFTRSKPLFKVGYDEELVKLVRSIPEAIQTASSGFQQVLAARVAEVLARVRASDLQQTTRGSGADRKISQARCFLLEHSNEEIDFKQLAITIGMSYTRFRAVFKTHTGFSPLQYQLNIRINKAKAILSETYLTVGEIADQLGFSSVYYFSRLFRNKTGLSPTAYRASGGRRTYTVNSIQ